MDYQSLEILSNTPTNKVEIAHSFLLYQITNKKEKLLTSSKTLPNFSKGIT